MLLELSAADSQSLFCTAIRLTLPNRSYESKVSSSHWGGKLRVPIHPLLVEWRSYNIDRIDRSLTDGQSRLRQTKSK